MSPCTLGVGRHPVRTRCGVFGVVSVLGLLSWATPCRALAGGPPTIVLSSSRFAVLSDGRDTAEIIAEVRDSSGRYAADGTVVTFSTNLGVFSDGGPATKQVTRSGTARARLSSQQKGTATVTASVPGGGFQKLDLLFTDDPAETVQGNAYVSVEATGTLAYAAVERTIEATSRPGDAMPSSAGAKLTFRNLTIRAERLQVDCTSNIVRAMGQVTVARGKQNLACAKLYYNLLAGKGYAVTERGRALVPVVVEGHDLQTTVSETGIAPKFFEMTDLADARLTILARQIILFPGDKLQFKRPRFYEDGGHLFTLGFYSLSLYSSQLFSDQFLSVGTQGVGLDLPLYYDLTPVSKGVFRVKYGERYGSAYARRPGFAMDLLQSYNAAPRSGRYSGEFGFTGLTRGDWGFRWTHSQEFGADTLTAFHLDFPQHRSVFGSANLSQRLGGLRLGLNGSANRSLEGPATNGTQADMYLETLPVRVKGTPLMTSLGGNVATRRTVSGDYRTYSLTEGIQVRAFTPSIRLDSLTSLSNAVSVGHIWSNTSARGATVYASVNATRSLGGSRMLQLGYDYVQQPISTGDGRHRLGLSLGSSDARWALYFYNTLMVDTGAMSLIGDLQYSLAPRWRVGLSASVQRYQDGSYSDIILALARNIGGRDVVLSYSTFNHRIVVDLEATRF